HEPRIALASPEPALQNLARSSPLVPSGRPQSGPRLMSSSLRHAGATTRPPPGFAVGGCMRARSRRRLEMGTRALAFSRANPDSNPGYETAVARLEELIGRAAMLSDQQRNGKVDVRFASRRKRALRRAITQGHIAHLVGVAQVAEQEVPGLTDRFRLSLLGTTYMEFRAAA